jgi:hypothetical protein
MVQAGPLEIRVGDDGRLRLGWNEPDWFGPIGVSGVGVMPSEWRPTADGALHMDCGWLRAGVRALADEPVVLLSLTALEGTPKLATEAGFDEPCVAFDLAPEARAPNGAPAAVHAFGHQYMQFALPVFSDASMQRWRLLGFRPAAVVPLGLVAPDGRTVLLVPLSNVHEQVIAVPDRRYPERHTLRAGWHGDIDAVPAGFATELAVIAGDGTRDCYATWARLLRAASGVAPPPRDADTLATRLSYWTDNGSAYWYRTEGDLDPASTIVAAVDDLEARGLPVGAVQLDSWWYPHEVSRPFDTDEWEVPPTGMLRWEPRDDVLPDGVAALRERLGRRPLVTHCRHLSSRSTYGEELPLWIDADHAHPQTSELYERFLDQALGWGVEVFEHDWLIECFLGVRALRQPGRSAEWQRGLDAALVARGLHAQWCMASPADIAHVANLSAVTSIRTSGDTGYMVEPPTLWAWFLHNNVIARALGLWPYKDVFLSAPEHPEREMEALLAALSAGPVGIGDRIGEVDVDLVRRTCRADGVLVRPDVPVAATDRAAYDGPVWSETLITGSAHTDHAAGRWSYVVTANVTFESRPASTRVELRDLGADVPSSERVVVYDWRRGSIELLAADGGFDVALEPTEWDYRVLVPVLPGGIAVVGDPRLYATAGDTRVAAVECDADGGGVAITVLGGHERVELVGWSATPLVFRQWSPTTGGRKATGRRDHATGAWRVVIDVPDAGWTRLHARPAAADEVA